MHYFVICLLFTVLTLSFSPLFSTSAQNDDDMGCNGNGDIERLILNELNRIRVTFSDAPGLLVPNPILDRVACEHAQHLSVDARYRYRRVDNQGNVEYLGDWLANAGYASYPAYDADNNLDRYDDTSDTFVYIGTDIQPTDLISLWVNNQDQYLSFNSELTGAPNPSLYSRRYREVGIAYLERLSTGQRYYVIVFGSEPDSIPVAITQPSLPYTIVPDGGEVNSQDIILNIANEYNETSGSDIGTVTRMRVSRLPFVAPNDSTANNPCNDDTLEVSFEFYRPEYNFRLNPGDGTQTIYIQLCDDIGNLAEVTINVLPNYLSLPEEEVVVEETVEVSVPEPTLTFTATATLMPTSTLTSTATENAPRITETPTATPTATVTPTVTQAPDEGDIPEQQVTAVNTADTAGLSPLTLTLSWEVGFLVIASDPSNTRVVDLTQVDFVAENGVIFRPFEEAGAERNALTNIPAEDCVVIFNLVSSLEPPTVEDVRERAFCVHVVDNVPIGENIFWGLNNLPDFTVRLDGEPIALCTPRNSESCVVTLSADALISSHTPPGGTQVSIQALWMGGTFVIINTHTEGVNLSNLRLEGESGEISPENWAMTLEYNETLDNVRPGSCLVAHFGTEPALPDGLTCSRIIATYTLENSNQIVWQTSETGFNVINGGLEEEIICETASRMSCELRVFQTTR